MRKPLLALFALLFLCSGDWIARTDGSVTNPSGMVLPADANWGNRAVARAVQMAQHGDRVLVSGDHFQSGSCRALSLGEKASGFGQFVAGPKTGIVLVGVDGGRIGPVTVYQRFGGISGFRFESLNVVGEYNHGFLFASGQEHIDFTFVDVEVEESPAPGWTKWGWRVHGVSQSFLWVRCKTSDLFEWAVYLDNPIGFGIEDCLFERCRRGGVQLVNRKESGRSGGGVARINGTKILGCGIDGAASITIAGFLGTVDVAGCEIRSQHDTFGVLGWFEGPAPSKGKLGAWKNEAGNAIDEIRFGPRNIIDVANGRGPVAFGSCSLVTVAQNEWIPNDMGKPDIWTDVPGVTFGGVDQLTFWGESPSAWPTWSGGVKVRDRTNDWSDDQIDARAWSR